MKLVVQTHGDATGLHYNRHRYYDPHVGRFVSKDPIGLAGGVNVYQYAPNAIEWVDPLGLWGSNPLTKYRYNENGTLKSATAKIRPEDLGTGTATNASSRAAARAFGCASDDAGHPIARNLGGLGGVKEVIPQDPSTNRGAFNRFESQIADHVASGDNVIVRVVPQCGSGSTRPDSILYQTRVNGRP